MVNKKDKKGLVGIGALIVFISIIVISIISAGVLINVTGMIEGQTYKTAERATDSVSKGLRIKGVTGTADENGEYLSEIQILVKKFTGSPGINLETTTIEFMTSEEIIILKYGENITENTFTVKKVVDDKGGITQLETEVDMSKIIINTEKIMEEKGDSFKINPNDSFEISFIPEVGFKTYVDVYAPPTLEDNNQYRIRV
ncbi:MAG: hypothetical protein ACOCP8_00975 [archaeon]